MIIRCIESRVRMSSKSRVRMRTGPHPERQRSEIAPQFRTLGRETFKPPSSNPTQTLFLLRMRTRLLLRMRTRLFTIWIIPMCMHTRLFIIWCHDQRRSQHFLLGVAMGMQGLLVGLPLEALNTIDGRNKQDSMLSSILAMLASRYWGCQHPILGLLASQYWGCHWGCQQLLATPQLRLWSRPYYDKGGQCPGASDTSGNEF